MKPEEYDSWFTTPFGAYADKLERELVFRFLGEVRGKRILDVGCGTGNYAIALSKMGARVVGIDASKEMIEYAKKKAKKEGVQVKFLIGEAESLPFGDSSFDILLSVTACEFLRDMRKVAREMRRVAKEKIVIGIINRWSLYCVEKRIAAIFKRDSVYSRARFYAPHEIAEIFGGKTRWESTLFAQDWFPEFLLNFFAAFEKPLSKILKLFGAFVVLEVVLESEK